MLLLIEFKSPEFLKIIFKNGVLKPFKMAENLPNIYLYNPTCEYAIANGKTSWQPNRILQKMESDLSALPLFFAQIDDFVLVDKIPSLEFIASLKQIGIETPNFILKTEAIQNQQFINFQKNKLLPWGWSPAMHKFLSPLKESCSVEFQQSPVISWKPEHREITSRKFAAGILNQLITTNHTDFILPIEFSPKICYTKNDIENAIKQWGNIMIKAPWSSSGRGLQTITKTPVHPKVWEKIMGIIKEQGYTLVEPFLNKVLDLALQFELKKGKIEFLGISNFCTNKNGQYEGNHLNGLPGDVEERLLEFTDFAVREIRQSLINAIETSEMAIYYEGVFGVDTLIYADANNLLKINPCLEINVRYTMGLLSLLLEKLINQNKKAVYRTYYKPGTSFYVFTKEMEMKYPLKISDNKIDSGFFALTEAVEDSIFGAYLLV